MRNTIAARAKNNETNENIQTQSQTYLYICIAVIKSKKNLIKMVRSERLKRVTLAKAFSLQKWTTQTHTHTYFQAIKQYAPLFLYSLAERTKISVCITSYMLAAHTHKYTPHSDKDNIEWAEKTPCQWQLSNYSIKRRTSESCCEWKKKPEIHKKRDTNMVSSKLCEQHSVYRVSV